MIKYMGINGKRIFVDFEGGGGLPPLLFIHGGPGGVGVTDFVESQADRLSKEFMVISPEQRGIWRSEALGRDEPISEEIIIEDYEEIRRRLGIKKWSVIGHSFGGHIVAKYAYLHPEAIACIIFENGLIDMAETDRLVLKYQVNELRRTGQNEAAESCGGALNGDNDFRVISKALKDATKALRLNGYNYLWHTRNHRVFSAMNGTGPNAEDFKQKSLETRHKFIDGGKPYESAIGYLPFIQCPCLFIRGKYDVMISDDLVKETVSKIKRCDLEIFYNSSHWVRIEEPEKYADTVTHFINRCLHESENKFNA